MDKIEKIATLLEEAVTLLRQVAEEGVERKRYDWGRFSKAGKGRSSSRMPTVVDRLTQSILED